MKISLMNYLSALHLSSNVMKRTYEMGFEELSLRVAVQREDPIHKRKTQVTILFVEALTIFLGTKKRIKKLKVLRIMK